MKDLNIKEMMLVIDISNFEFKKDPNLNEFAEFLELRPDNTSFIKIRKFLEGKKIIKIKSERGNKIISLDKKKIEEEIPEFYFIKYYEQNFRYRHKGFTYE